MISKMMRDKINEEMIGNYVLFFVASAPDLQVERHSLFRVDPMRRSPQHYPLPVRQQSCSNRVDSTRTAPGAMRSKVWKKNDACFTLPKSQLLTRSGAKVMLLQSLAIGGGEKANRRTRTAKKSQGESAKAKELNGRQNHKDAEQNV